MSKEIPILFSTPMVQAILAGRKTQTRRVLKPQPDEDGLARFIPTGEFHDTSGAVYKPKWQVGDKIWVRETWALNWNDFPEHPFKYRADYGPETVDWNWKPSLFMPREACRLFLKVTDIRVERLQDISEEDAEAEGYSYESWHRMNEEAAGVNLYSIPKDTRTWFRTLWDSINSDKCPWESNPWVWVITFEKYQP